MTLALFTDEDFAEADREINEATRGMIAGVSAAGPSSSVYPDFIPMPLPPRQDRFVVELTEEDLELDNSELPSQFAWEPSSNVRETHTSGSAVVQAGHLVWITPSLALLLGLGTGTLGSDFPWHLAAGIMLLALLAANGRKLEVAGETMWGAVGIHCFALARFAADTIATQTLSGFLQVAAGTILAGAAIFSIIRNNVPPETSLDLRDPEFGDAL